MALSIIKTEGFHAVEFFHGPRETCGGILATGEEDECGFHAGSLALKCVVISVVS